MVERLQISVAANNNNSGANMRRYVRTNMRTLIKLIHPACGEVIVHTGDLSDGGVYIHADGLQLPEVGERVQVQVQGLPVEAPLIEAKIVRSDENGIGLEFVSP